MPDASSPPTAGAAALPLRTAFMAAPGGVANPDHPEWGPWGEPFFGISYAPMGYGKSLDLCRLIAGEGTAIAQEGGVKPALGVLGVDFGPRRQRTLVHTLDQATLLVQKIGALPADHPRRPILRILGIDDGSLLLDTTMREIERNPPRAKSGQVDYFEIWDMVKDKLHMFLTACRWAGVSVWANFHERGPGRDNKTGEYYKGGPSTASLKLTRFLGHFPDIVLRGGLEAGRKPWAGIYECNGLDDADFATKDRHGVVSGRAPMNAAEIMRAAGYRVARPPGLEWQDDVAEAVASAIIEGRLPEAEILSRVATGLWNRHGYDPRHIRWAVHQDGADRAVLRRNRLRIFADLGIAAPGVPAAPVVQAAPGGLA